MANQSQGIEHVHDVNLPSAIIDEMKAYFQGVQKPWTESGAFDKRIQFVEYVQQKYGFVIDQENVRKFFEKEKQKMQKRSNVSSSSAAAPGVAITDDQQSPPKKTKNNASQEELLGKRRYCGYNEFCRVMLSNGTYEFRDVGSKWNCLTDQEKQEFVDAAAERVHSLQPISEEKLEALINGKITSEYKSIAKSAETIRRLSQGKHKLVLIGVDTQTSGVFPGIYPPMLKEHLSSMLGRDIINWIIACTLACSPLLDQDSVLNPEQCNGNGSVNDTPPSPVTSEQEGESAANNPVPWKMMNVHQKKQAIRPLMLELVKAAGIPNVQGFPWNKGKPINQGEFEFPGFKVSFWPKGVAVKDPKHYLKSELDALHAAIVRNDEAKLTIATNQM